MLTHAAHERQSQGVVVVVVVAAAVAAAYLHQQVDDRGLDRVVWIGQTAEKKLQKMACITGSQDL